jgi:uncharacterized LabA/DUF88 family protein
MMSTTPTDPTTVGPSQDHADTPATEAAGTAPARRRHRRATPHAARIEPTPEVTAAEPEPAVAEAPAAPSAPAATTPRRNTRRTSRPFAPKLVTPAPVEEASVPAPEAAQSIEAVSTALSEPASAVEAQSPKTEEVPPKRHRFRFERPTTHTPQFAPRPERLSGPVVAPSNGAVPSAPANSTATVMEEHGTGARYSGATEPAAPASVAAEASAQRKDQDVQTAREIELVGSHTELLQTAEEPADGAREGIAEETEESTAARRRRRRRRSGGAAIRHLEAITPVSDDAEPYAGDDEVDAYAGAREVTVIPDYGEPARPAAPHGSAQQDAWNVGSAQQQLGQPRSPFGSPEPSTPRGFGAQPEGAAAPYQERPPRAPRIDRSSGDISSVALTQLGATLTQAIQQQTDRLLVTMRHIQAPPTMTLALPAMPSTERIGVFVDVANLLYSSRSLRVGIDFGRLLDFLRATRHVVRAHAYAPTNPEPNAEQQFLSVVKGVGYRITTKNFKVFSSGAKKADLDLDLCMDIVRLVDAKAVDTIVLVSGDSDFLPLLEYCSDRGVRVEVAAFEDAAALVLRQSCDLFINLSLVDEIRP